MADWQAWSRAFLRPEGRVVDVEQDGASHSEGQAYGLLLATWQGDRDAARRIVAWTEAHLAVRQDPLLAWRWMPGAGVADYNNASDGDVLYAWALLRAARTFGEEEFARRAREVAGAVVTILLATDPSRPGRTLLLPGAERFRDAGGVIVNPSYLMPLALHDLGAAFAHPELPAVAEAMADLLAGIATDGLVPDWIEVTSEGWRPAQGFSADFGYEAIRVPLYLVWSGRAGHPAVTAARTAWAARGDGPLPVRLSRDGRTVLEESAAPGYRAVAALVAATGASPAEVPAPPFDAAQPYYPATIHMLAGLARHDRGWG